PTDRRARPRPRNPAPGGPKPRTVNSMRPPSHHHRVRFAYSSSGVTLSAAGPPGARRFACCAGQAALARYWAYCALVLALVLPVLTRVGVAAAAAAAAAKPVAASLPDDARSWLVRADQALAQRNYRGVFVHEYGGETETLR